MILVLNIIYLWIRCKEFCSKNMRVDTLITHVNKTNIPIDTNYFQELMKIIYTPFYIIKNTQITNNFKCFENNNTWEFISHSTDKKLELDKYDNYTIRAYLNKNKELYKLDVICFLQKGLGYKFTIEYKYKNNKYFMNKAVGETFKENNVNFELQFLY